jgi:hypothetical protein
MDDDDEDQKPTLEEIETMLMVPNDSEQNNNLAELKPLPPFTGEWECGVWDIRDRNNFIYWWAVQSLGCQMTQHTTQTELLR